MVVQLGPKAFLDLGKHQGWAQCWHKDTEFRRLVDKQRLWLGWNSILVPSSMYWSPHLRRGTGPPALEGGLGGGQGELLTFTRSRSWGYQDTSWGYQGMLLSY